MNLLSKEHYKALGDSEEGVLKLTTRFYSKVTRILYIQVFQEPILVPMFREINGTHATRLSWLLITMMGVNNKYFEERGGFGRIHSVSLVV
jgi:truncated hemoglobin YjbI